MLLGRGPGGLPADLESRPVLAALMLILPLGLGGSVSPVMLTEQTLLLAGPDGRRAGTQYAVGAALTLLVVVLAVVLFGAALSLPSEPRLDASLDLALGAILVLLAGLGYGWVRLHPRAGHHQRPSKASRRRRAALPFGAFSMATNFTTLALVLPAAKEIASADLEVVGKAVLALVLVGLASAPAWLPVVLTRVAPAAGQRILDATAQLIADHGRQAIVALLSFAGLFFVARGLVRLSG
jgi:Sap, sulfolipid-1-addressing protein